MKWWRFRLDPSARGLWVGLVVLWGFGGLACGEGPDNWPSGRPLIFELLYLEGIPMMPGQLAFLLRFQDTDGNVGPGKVRIHRDRGDSLVLEGADVFGRQDPPLALDATRGELEIPVSVQDVPPGERFRIGFVLEDADGRMSNEPSVVLQALEPGN